MTPNSYARLHACTAPGAYDVEYNGRFILLRSRDPECAAARELLARGITGTLTLLNNPFVLSEAAFLATRVIQQASDPRSQVELAYRMALARPATETEIAIGIDLIKKQSLASFTHVVMNLDEFLYMR